MRGRPVPNCPTHLCQVSFDEPLQMLPEDPASKMVLRMQPGMLHETFFDDRSASIHQHPKHSTPSCLHIVLVII